MSESMRLYLQQTFQLEPELFDESSWAAGDQTFISAAFEMGGCCRVSLLLKRHNHKKINSHEWFFLAHAPNTTCVYALTTDTGAVFRSGTVAKLARHLNSHPRCVAVTGRQRIMSFAHQRRQSGNDEEPLFDWALRALQGEPARPEAHQPHPPNPHPPSPNRSRKTSFMGVRALPRSAICPDRVATSMTGGRLRL
eukprot:4989837-Prymnesium_polylepis.1